MKKKIITIIISILLLVTILGGIAAFMIYRQINAPAFAITQDKYIYISENGSYSGLLKQLEDSAHLKNTNLFNQLADRMKYSQNVKSGRYKVSPEISYLEIIRLLRNGSQEPIRLTFNNIRLKENLADRIEEQLMFNRNDLLECLNNQKVTKDLGFDTTTILTLFIPNTYDIYWNTSAENFLIRMKNEYNRFWTDERIKKAEKIGLTPIEVSILASIVEEETAVNSEYPIVAGVYLNRLKKGMLLQADPTVKFAVGDVTLRRILFKHLEVDSPYNTYRNLGLPPGPIRIPSIAGIDGVLNYAQHNYLYMCAKEDFSGTHNFAATLGEHTKSARRYQEALNRAGIR